MKVGQKVVITYLEGKIDSILGEVFVISVGKTIPLQVCCYREQFKVVKK